MLAAGVLEDDDVVDVELLLEGLEELEALSLEDVDDDVVEEVLLLESRESVR